MSPNPIQLSPSFSLFFFNNPRYQVVLDQVYEIVGLYALPLKKIMIKFVQSQMGTIYTQNQAAKYFGSNIIIRQHFPAVS